MKAGVLCSHPFAFPSIEWLHSQGKLAGLGAPLKEGVTPWLNAVANQAFVPMQTIEGEGSLGEWLDLVMPDVVFVLGFPHIIPGKFLSVPPHGFYNFHTGILPAYRGVDPVFWQIRKREPHGGITVHQMTAGIDNGPIAHVEKTGIPAHETYGAHLNRLSFTARSAVSSMIEKLEQGPPELEEQSPDTTGHPSRPAFNDLLIDWEEQPSRSIKALVQAANPAYGGAVTFYKGMHLRILEVSTDNLTVQENLPPGTIVSTGRKLSILCSDRQALSMDIIYSDAGLFSGKRFISLFEVKEGDHFSTHQFQKNPQGT